MKKVLMRTHVCDENGSNVPAWMNNGQSVELPDGAAQRYVQRGWAIFVQEEKAEVEEHEEESEEGQIETPEDSLPEQETATLKRRGRPRKLQI